MDAPLPRGVTPHVPPHPLEEIDTDLEKMSWEIMDLLIKAHA